MTTTECASIQPQSCTTTEDLIEQAARPIPLLWPLTTAISANPLWDLRDRSFEHATTIAAEVLGIDGLPSPRLLSDAYLCGRITDADLTATLDGEGPAESWRGDGDSASPWRTVLEDHDWLTGSTLAALTDREVGKWCALYVTGRAVPDGDSAGLYDVWRSQVVFDPIARRWGIGSRYPLAATAADAILGALESLGVTADERLAELTAQLARLPGWAAHAKWRTQWAAPDYAGPTLTLADLLAVRLNYDAAAYTSARATASTSASRGTFAQPGTEDLSMPSPRDPVVAARLEKLPHRRQRQVWLAAYERHYRDQFLAKVDAIAASTREHHRMRPAAQLVCCIDTRSEGIRRHVEAQGNYETFGFAGFFGVPAQVLPFNSEDRLDLLPVLLRPAMVVRQRPLDAFAGAGAAAAAADLSAAESAVSAAQKAPLSAYLLAEAGGFVLGPAALFRTLAPRAAAAMRRWIRARLSPHTELEYVTSGPDAPTDDQQAAYAESALRAMGLTERFARLVVLCGHGSTTTNNPYASSLDCGACGAARGATSARLAAAMLNRPAVRGRLAAAGVEIPADTVFLAAEHDTATDTVTWFDVASVPETHRSELARLRDDVRLAGRALASERASDLPGAPRKRAAAHVAARSADWAQTQPEWGLARNAAFLIAPRRVSAGVYLGRRSFLHSYEPETDSSGTVLEAILAGPMVVAHWINTAYYFSTVDPDVLGAGDKVAHNVVGGIGVYQGAGGDLRIGLPRQSVFTRPGVPYHEPMRLLVAVTAPRERVDAVLDRNETLTHLVAGSWIQLAAHDGHRWWLRGRRGWTEWQSAITAEDHPTTRPLRSEGVTQ
ncbi:DUF2309 domain-containing protein [Hoyosella sp. YIM 151337]|uniref:DUF2309 domain-containing protein n=1 Tax=Hoyosella sp. YIM 151337 TaxID=2992742 RepID=UPI002236BD2B|nr:DUF2309 domain-containing protein [Hoyosella sp. YIM 151337]MCW4356086.1 DUF2309 domain-containing protein [Hoyosella sp. YIM 151337]